MANRIQLRRDTAANWASADPILANGEPGYDLTNDILKVGDGTTAWSSLPTYGGGGGGGPTALNDLTDVSTVGAANGNALVFNGTSWGPGAGGGGASSLPDLSDVTLSSLATADVLRYDGSGWRNASLVLADISDFNAADYATGTEGDLATTAIQPGANVSVLTNDAGFITGLIASQVPFTPAGSIAATDVQAAIEEVASEASSGLPNGGTAGQGLVKQSVTDQDADWENISQPVDLLAPPPGAWQPTDVVGSTVLNWWDASDETTIALTGAQITQWNDKVGGNTATAIGSVNKTVIPGALNSRNVIDFPGEGGFTLASDIDLFNQTFFIVARHDNTSLGQIIAELNSDNQIRFQDTGGEVRLTTNLWGGLESTGQQEGQFYLITVRGIAGGAELYIDGTLVATGPSTAGASRLFSRIGVRASNNEPLNGAIASIIVLNSATDTTAILEIEGGESHKFGLQGALRSDHPFKAAPPGPDPLSGRTRLIPLGGTTGQALVKVSNDDAHVTWQTVSGGGGGASVLNDLSDVTIAGPSSAQVLRYNGSLFVNATLNLADISDFDANNFATGAEGDLAVSAVQPGDNVSTLTNDAGYSTVTSLGDLSNVDLTGQATGLVLKFDGTNWTPQSDNVGGGGGGATQLNELSDVTLSGSTTGQVLRFNGTIFVNAGLVKADIGDFSDGDYATAAQGALADSALQSETDPVFTASPAFGITGTQITNWDTAFGWGDHATAGYLTSVTFNDLTDVTIASPATSEVIRYNGSAFVNAALVKADISDFNDGDYATAAQGATADAALPAAGGTITGNLTVSGTSTLTGNASFGGKLNLPSSMYGPTPPASGQVVGDLFFVTT